MTTAKQPEAIPIDGGWMCACSYEQKEIAKQAGFRWQPDQRRWFTSDPGAPDKLAALVSPQTDDELTVRYPEWVRKVRKIWVALVGFDQRDLAKQAGFRWQPDDKCWATANVEVARKYIELRAIASGRLKPADAQRLAEQLHPYDESFTVDPAIVEASRATDGPTDIPAPAGVAYLPYQRGGIAYARRFPNVLIADEMGLGKTIQAIGVINDDPSIEKVLVVCPATPKRNWYRELSKWLVRPLRLAVAEGKSCPVPPWANVTIINYDICARHEEKLRSVEWDLVILDECHYLKNYKAQRTRAILGGKVKGGPTVKPIPARRRVLLTGTPIPNRPIECLSLVKAMGVEINGRRLGVSEFTHRFLREDGAAQNLDQLQLLLRGSGMVRRLKADVLTDLPPKIRQVIEMTVDGELKKVAGAADAAEGQYERLALDLAVAKELAKADDAFAGEVARLSALVRVAFADVSKRRHECALLMAPAVIAQVIENLQELNKVILFAHHSDVIQTYADALDAAGIKWVKITGSTPQPARQEAVDRFQKDPETRVFLGNIIAAGTAITLTAANYVAFGELDWVPGNMQQAEDRAHRIGQRDSVLVHYFVPEDTLQARMAKTLVDKARDITAALDAQVEARAAAPVTDEWTPPELEATDPEAPATASAKRERVEEVARTLSEQDIAHIHGQLRMLAAADADRARYKNGIGFNAVDGAIGHRLAALAELTPKQAALAAIMLAKYQRQLGELA